MVEEVKKEDIVLSKVDFGEAAKERDKALSSSVEQADLLAKKMQEEEEAKKAAEKASELKKQEEEQKKAEYPEIDEEKARREEEEDKIDYMDYLDILENNVVNSNHLLSILKENPNNRRKFYDNIFYEFAHGSHYWMSINDFIAVRKH